MWYPFHAVQLDAESRQMTRYNLVRVDPLNSPCTKPGLLCFDPQARAFRKVLQREGSHLPVGNDILGNEHTHSLLVQSSCLMLVARSTQSACLDQI